MRKTATAAVLLLLASVGVGAYLSGFGEVGWSWFHQDQLDEAEREWLDALADAEARGDREAAAEARYNLAYVYQRKGEVGRALAAIEAAVQETNDRHPALFDRVSRLATLYVQADRLADAEETWRELVLRYGGGTDAARDRRGQALFELARLYHETGRHREAERTYLESLRTLQPLGTHSFVAFALEGLASIYEAQERYTAAQEACEKRLSAIRALGRPEDEQDAIGADCHRLELLAISSDHTQRDRPEGLDGNALHPNG